MCLIEEYMFVYVLDVCSDALFANTHTFGVQSESMAATSSFGNLRGMIMSVPMDKDMCMCVLRASHRTYP